MECKEAQLLIHPYVDRELDAAHSLEVDRHIENCAACTQAADRVRAVSQAVSSAGLRFSAPPMLANQIRAAIKPQPPAAPLPSKSWWSYLAIAASLLAVSLLGLEWTRGIRESVASDRLISELVDDHVRSLMANHLLDVASSDKHTVRPWFTGKIDFAPSVPDLKDHDIPLVGGRLDVLAGQPAVALVYQHGKHVVNVFVRPIKTSSTVPSHTPAQPTIATHQGFNIASWSDDGFDYAAVSDLNAIEFREFVALMQAAMGTTL
ncbi:MAG TPA: anti-sigma factor [Lacipirellulaceae bacterium]|nr:anti-sigma factor [Lacipirellulaceae bacterium]